MLYVCLSGYLPSASMFLIPPCLNLYDMYIVNIQYLRNQFPITKL